MSRRCSANDLKYGFDNDTILALKSTDPTGSQCIYLDWIYRQYKSGEFLLEDITRVKEDLTLFHDNKVRLEGNDKDINSLTYGTLKILLRDKFRLELDEIVQTNMTDVTVLYDGPLGKLYSPLTKEASCRLGSGTKWCTSSEKNNMFEHYNQDGPLYIWVDSHWNKGIAKSLGNKSKKFQFHFETAQFMDELDNPIGDALLDYYRIEHPIISQLFRRYEDSLRTPKEIVNYVDRLGNKEDLITRLIVNQQDKRDREVEYVRSRFYLKYPITQQVMDIVIRSEEYIASDKDPLELVKYIIKNRNNDRSLIDKYIVGDVNRELQYAIINNNTWKNMLGRPDIDEHILMNRKLVIKYITSITNMVRFTVDDMVNINDIVIRAIVLWEKGISIPELYNEGPDIAEYYAIYVIRCRSKYIEDMGIPGDIYHQLFILGQDIPKDMRELTPKHVDVLYGNEELYFGQVNTIDNVEESFKTIIDTYGAYVKKYGRSEIIERGIVKHFGENKYILTYLSITVFGYRISYALEYINMDIEVPLKSYELYRNIFITKDDTRESIYIYILFYIMVNGSTKTLLDRLVNMFNNNDIDDYENISTALTYEDLQYIYDRLNVNSGAMFVLYPLLTDTRSMELEERFVTLMNDQEDFERLVIARSYENYWLKFLKGSKVEQFSDMEETLEIYYDNYKGILPNIEKYYVPPESYLMSRVKQ